MDKAPVTLATLALERRGKLGKDWFSLWMILDGNVKVINELGSFSAGTSDLFSTTPGEEFTVIPEEKAMLLVISIDEVMFQEALGHASTTIFCNSTMGKNCRKIRSQLLKVAEAYYSTDKGHELHLTGQLYELLYILNANFELSPSEHHYPENDEQGRKRAIEHYLSVHYREEITLQALSEQFHLSPQYFSKYFKSAFGQNFLSYLRSVRLDHATKEMLSSDKAITKIAYGSGFPNLTAFNKAFKDRYGVSPNQYLRQYGLKAGPERKPEPSAAYEVSQADVITILKNYISYDGGAEEPEASDDIRVVEQVSIAPAAQAIFDSWNEIINIEAASFCLNSEFQRQIKSSRNILKFRYARLLHLTSSEVFKGGVNQEKINFSNFSRIIEFLHSVGLKPMFELGPKPPREIFSPRHQNIQHIYAPPVDKMMVFLRKLLIYSINRWGLDEVNSWRFEMWAPQSEDLRMEDHTPDSYAHYYEATYKTIKSLAPKAEVGGMGLNINLQSVDIAKKVMLKLRELGLEPDFLSVCFYPAYVINMDHAAGNVDIGAILHSDENRLAEKLDSIQKVMYSVFPNLKKVYITEYSSDISSYFTINETCYKSAFIVKTVIDNFEKVAGMGYWYFSDLIYESNDWSAPLFGGNGLVSRDGLKKPGYFAFQFLGKMGNQLIARGKNYMMTSRRDNMYEVLIHNYKNLSSSYCIEYFKENALTISDSYFDDVSKMRFELRVSGIKAGKYIIKKYTLNDHNSLIAGMQKLNYTKVLKDEELDYLTGTCVPQQRLDAISCDSEMVISTNLEPNEVTLFLISPVAEL